MPRSTGPGYNRYRDHVRKASAAYLERLHPVWSAFVRDESERDAIRHLGTAPPKYKADRFASYRQLLTMILDLELHLGHLAVLSRLVDAVPSQASLEALRVTEDEWVWLLQQDHAIAVFALFDRVGRIVTRSCRLLIRAYDRVAAKTAEERLTALVEQLRDKAGRGRHSVAHGLLDTPDGGAANVLLQPGYWEVPIARGDWPSTENYQRSSNPDLLTAQQRFAMLTQLLGLAIVGADRIFAELDATIDWRRLQAD